LLAALRRLADELDRSAAYPAALVRAVQAAAAGPAEDRHTTVVLGEKSRGKTTLVNRLLGRAVLPAGRRGTGRTVRLRHGKTWRALLDDAATEVLVVDPPFPGDEAKPYRLIEGPADLLRFTALVDTPGLNNVDQGLEAWALREALAADLVVVCLSAEQLLSETERRLVREQLLPLTSCPLLAAVTHLDRVEQEEDRQELEARLRRFLESVPPGRVQAVRIAGGGDPTGPAPELENAIRNLAARVGQSQRETWAGRVDTLLGLLEPLLADPPAAPPPAPAPGEAFEDVRAALRREHDLALREATSHLRAGLADLRLSLPARVADLTPERLRHECAARLIADVHRLGREAARSYLSSLQGSLADDGPAALRTTVALLNPDAAGAAMPPPARLVLAPAARPPRDWKTMCLTGVGIAVLAASTTWVPIVGGALALVGAEYLRRSRRLRFGDESRAEAVAAVQEWLAATEPALVEQLRTEAELVLAQLQQTLGPAPAALPPASPAAGLRALWSTCREALDAYPAGGDKP
jgi:hypothetical protein